MIISQGQSYGDRTNVAEVGLLTDGAASNKQHSTSLNTAKLDRETEELRHEKVPADVGRLIQQGRQAKKWTQKDLATVSSVVSLASNCGL